MSDADLANEQSRSDQAGAASNSVSRGHEFVQELYRADKKRPPSILLQTSRDPSLGTDPVPSERYFSREFYALEKEKVWKKVWQMACWAEDIPRPGDIHVYELDDISILVVRQPDLSIKAFYNSCLHRGRKFHEEDAHASLLRCPYHGLTWKLNGEALKITSEWDFPQIDKDKFCLPQVRVDQWNGFVFICMDEDTPPLDEYLEDIPFHWKDWDLTGRFKSAHVVKKMPGNWKTVMDAFIESFHVENVHPQTAPYSGIEQAQYDVWPGKRHFSRTLTPAGMPTSAGSYPLTEQQIVDRFIQAYMPGYEKLIGAPDATLREGQTAREVIGNIYTDMLSEQLNVDLSDLDTACAIDAVFYYIFPNFQPWPTLAYPLFYRFRPLDDDPNQCLMDIIILSPFQGERPPSAEPVFQEFEEPLANALGVLGEILDQDCTHVRAIQTGMKAAKEKKLNLAEYQDSRVRHYHLTLGEYIEAP